MATLTVFYDGSCPLCMREMQSLRRYDREQRLSLVDLRDRERLRHWPQIDRDAAMAILHAVRDDGSLVTGLDVTAEAWSLVGRHRWLKILRLPGIRVLADVAYRGFARHRYRLSGLLTGKQVCDSNDCSI